MNSVDEFSSGKTPREIAEILAPVFEEQGWEWSSTAGVPDQHALAASVARAGWSFVEEDGVESTESGRIVLERDDLGVRVLLSLGHLKGSGVLASEEDA